MYGRGPFWGGRYMRRRGFPLFPMGGYGMGMGGGGLIGDLMAGGIGYMMGKQSAQQAPQYQPPQYQPQTPNISHHKHRSTSHHKRRNKHRNIKPQTNHNNIRLPSTNHHKHRSLRPPTGTPNQQVTAASGVNERLAQLKLLGHLRDSGLLTDDEFEVEKQKIMQG